MRTRANDSPMIEPQEQASVPPARAIQLLERLKTFAHRLKKRADIPPLRVAFELLETGPAEAGRWIRGRVGG
jgi:hypothetical protein